MLIPQCPDSIRETDVYRWAGERSSASDGFLEKIDAFIDATTPLLDSIVGGPFQAYTLHNRGHAIKIVHLVPFIAARKTHDNLSGIDCLLLIFSAYFHDLGLNLSNERRIEILKSQEFEDHLRSWPQVWTELDKLREQVDLVSDKEKLEVELRLFQLQEAALSDYLRPRHSAPNLYRELAAQLRDSTGRKDLFKVNDVSFEDILVDICESHNLPATSLNEITTAQEDRFPRQLPIGGHLANIQFVAALLRLADILDFDRERTPKTLFQSLGIATRVAPGSSTSLREWQKHLAIHSLEINEDEVVVSADCDNPAVERGIRDFCDVIASEIRDTTAVLNRNPSHVHEHYEVDLPYVVRPRIRSHGYVYTELSLSLDEAAILSLLMGNQLYQEGAVALREVLQNAVDACAARKHLSDDTGYSPKISVRTESDAEGWWVVVEDNGLGMDHKILGEYFFRVGKSFYESVDFERLTSGKGRGEYAPISRFGIGILSVFMVADLLEVHTRSSLRWANDEVGRILRVEGMGAVAFMRETASLPVGSKIRFRLSENLVGPIEDGLDRMAQYVASEILRPAVPIDVQIGPHQYGIRRSSFYRTKENAGERLKDIGVELIQIDVSEHSEKLSGLVMLFLSRDSDGLLDHRLDGKLMEVSYSGIPDRVFLDPSSFIESFSGNRTTVNGFRMSFRRIGRLFRRGKSQIANIIDTDVQASPEITFDVGRTKITGLGPGYVRQFIRSAVIAELRAKGLLDQLHSDTRKILGRGAQPLDGYYLYVLANSERIERIDDESVLRNVESSIKSREWTPNVHRSIAKELSLSNRTALRALSTLLLEGRIKKPDRTETTANPTTPAHSAPPLRGSAGR